MDKRILGTKVYARGILRHFGAFYTGEGQSREKSEAGRVRKELTVDDCDTVLDREEQILQSACTMSSLRECTKGSK